MDIEGKIAVLKLAGFALDKVKGMWEWIHMNRGLISKDYYRNPEEAWESVWFYIRGAKHEEFNAIPWSE